MFRISSEMETNAMKLIGITRDFITHALSETPTEQEVCECLRKKRFHFISQGIFDGAGNLKKTELLARLQESSGKILFPSTFTPIIEMKGLSIVFDYLVMEKAFEQIFYRNPSIPCAININPSTFDSTFINDVDRLYEMYSIHPSRIIFEILETEKIDDYDDFNTTLSELRKRGYKIAVDDFHPLGNHNAICIENLIEIDTVKIDGEYMKDLYCKKNSSFTVEDFSVNIKHIINTHPTVDIVVEKMEDHGMFEFFRDIFDELGIKNVCFQGYYFDKGSDF
ncbi:MAG: EAL domain-containing protein [Candidatus Gracilibacteria bacterium]|nr:EAL domain-containing protein [Candidatus Gracilibacteria bacterium]